MLLFTAVIPQGIFKRADKYMYEEKLKFKEEYGIRSESCKGAWKAGFAFHTPFICADEGKRSLFGMELCKSFFINDKTIVHGLHDINNLN